MTLRECQHDVAGLGWEVESGNWEVGTGNWELGFGLFVLLSSIYDPLLIAKLQEVA